MRNPGLAALKRRLKAEGRVYFNDWGEHLSVPKERLAEAQAWSEEENERLMAGKKERRLPGYFRAEELDNSDARTTMGGEA